MAKYPTAIKGAAYHSAITVIKAFRPGLLPEKKKKKKAGAGAEKKKKKKKAGRADGKCLCLAGSTPTHPCSHTHTAHPTPHTPGATPALTSAPSPHEEYVVKNQVVEFVANKQPHKNTPQQEGKVRYVFVGSNLDMDLKGKSLDPRSVELKLQFAALDPNYRKQMKVNEGPVVDVVRKALFDACEMTLFSSDRAGSGKPHAKYGKNKAQTLSLGATRKIIPLADDLTKRNWNEKKHNLNRHLYQAMQTYFEHFCPCLLGKYESWFIGKSSLCEWHVDVNNIGPSVITAIGPFEEGGTLLIRPAQGEFVCQSLLVLPLLQD
jgi:hypothetical protein